MNGLRLARDEMTMTYPAEELDRRLRSTDLLRELDADYAIHAVFTEYVYGLMNPGASDSQGLSSEDVIGMILIRLADTT